MKELERCHRKKEKAERKEARRAARVTAQVNFEECQRLLGAMFVMARNYQVHPVYPSGTDELEWHNPTPVSDRESPRLPEDQCGMKFITMNRI
jgi:hypothetical protein